MARSHSRQLQAQVEEFQEESLQEARRYSEASLLSELESSLEMSWPGVSKEEVLKQQYLIFPDNVQYYNVNFNTQLHFYSS